MSRLLQAIVGLALLTAGLSGPFTYADDWRHPGELAAAIGVALSGVLLLLPMIRPESRWAVSSRWMASLVLLGLAVGTAIDMTALGMAAGLIAGIAVALSASSPHTVDQGAIPKVARRS